MMDLADRRHAEVLISKFDLYYAYGQLKLSEEATIFCNFAMTGSQFMRFYKVLKGFHNKPDIPKIFQEEIDQTLANNHPAWLQIVILMTKRIKAKQWSA